MRIGTSSHRRLVSAIGLALLGASSLASAQQTALKTGVWYQPSESGWGLFTVDQGNVIAPAWYTFDSDGEPTWFLVTGAFPQADGSYKGDIARFTGVPFSQIMGNAADPETKIGEATFRFSADNSSLNFQYTVNGQTQSKSLSKFPLSSTKNIVCNATSGSRASATNYTDLWYGGASSSGWGMNILHVDDLLTSTWYTYDSDREAVFYTGLTSKQADGSYRGDIYREKNGGTPFLQINGNSPSAGSADVVGTLSIVFIDGQTADYTYTIGNVTQTKRITRLQVGSTTAVCAAVAINTGGGEPGADECYPPLAVGDRYRLRSTPGSGNIGETDVEIVSFGTEPFSGQPAFKIKYTPVGQSSASEVFEYIGQTASERIHYGSEGYIPEVQAQGTTRFVPAVRTPRSTPVGASGRLVYQAVTNYTAMGVAVSSTINFDETYQRVGTESQSSPAGSFADACKFNTTLKSDVSITAGPASIRTTVDAAATQWAHPDIGALRTESRATSTVTTSIPGSPVPVPPTTTNTTDLSEIVSASIGGRSYP